LDCFFAGEFDLVLSLSILTEVEGVLRRQHIRARPSFSWEDSRDVLVALLESAHVAGGAYQLDLVRTDPKDNHIVAAALKGGAEYIVTEDARDLLSLKVIKVHGFPPIQVVDAKGVPRIWRSRATSHLVRIEIGRSARGQIGQGFIGHRVQHVLGLREPTRPSLFGRKFGLQPSGDPILLVRGKGRHLGEDGFKRSSHSPTILQGKCLSMRDGVFPRD